MARLQSRWRATRFDLALLASALFLQRFSLAFGHSLMSLDVVPTALILIYLFASGRVLIIYDRLLWFLALGLAATFSLYLNFNAGMLPSYAEFILMYFLFTLGRPSYEDQYKSTLEAFQFLVLILSLLATAQLSTEDRLLIFMESFPIGYSRPLVVLFERLLAASTPSFRSPRDRPSSRATDYSW
jgi:hypothetical protein